MNGTQPRDEEPVLQRQLWSVFVLSSIGVVGDVFAAKGGCAPSKAESVTRLLVLAERGTSLFLKCFFHLEYILQHCPYHRIVSKTTVCTTDASHPAYYLLGDHSTCHPHPYHGIAQIPVHIRINAGLKVSS